ncbi:MAG: hypothetical protein K6E29_09385 [Cyanobacteria bacterium RUI128]|nr:hypothetical protein [Cyanobacteria bacterium RUI128]
MTLKFIDLYNDITSQAWSMFDSEVEAKDDFEASVVTSIQKALAHLWYEYEFEFRKRTYNIKTKVNKQDYSLPSGQIYKNNVVYNDENLGYLSTPKGLEEKEGEPEYFYIKNNKIVLYPIPDDVYTVEVAYLSTMPARNVDEEEKSNLVDVDDVINIDEQYEDLFRNTLLPLAMMYLIASETDENYSAYKWQYESALKKLKKCTTPTKAERVIGW